MDTSGDNLLSEEEFMKVVVYKYRGLYKWMTVVSSGIVLTWHPGIKTI